MDLLGDRRGQERHQVGDVFGLAVTAQAGARQLALLVVVAAQAFGLGARTDDPLAMYMSDYCTVPMPLAGIPAISIPAGLARPDAGNAGPDGDPAGAPELPVGFQIAGPAFSESGMLDAAYALERAIGFDAVPPSAGANGGGS